MPELTELNEQAAMAWINDSTTHGQTVGIEPRQYKQVKFDNTTLDPLEMPAVIVQAIQGQQLHTNVAVWKYDLEVTLLMIADDTNQAAWDTASMALETIFSVDALAFNLTSSGSHYLCRGVTSRNLGQTTIEDRKWKRVFCIQLWASRDAP